MLAKQEEEEVKIQARQMRKRLERARRQLARLDRGSAQEFLEKMEGVIEKSLDRLDKAGIAAYIRDNKR